MTRKNVISLVAFMLVAVMMFCTISHLFRDKESSFDNYYLEPENTIDAFFVGSSHVYSGYCPAVLWQEYGVSAYNVYAWSMPMWTGYYYVCEALKTQSPDVVFFDASSLIQNGGVYGEADEKFVDNREQNLWFKAGLERLLLSIESYTPDSELFDISLFHNKWKHPEKLTFAYSTAPDTSSLRNFGPLGGEVEFEIFNYSWDPMVAPPSKAGLKYLEKLVALSEKEGFRLVFILTPYDSNEQQNAVNNWLHEYAAQRSIDYIDFMMAPGVECGFDYRADMADADHVNSNGAFKLTRYCGEYLRSIGVSDRWDNPNAEQLTWDAKATYRVFEYTELFGENANAEEISGWLADSEDYSASLIFPETMTDAQRLFAEKLGIASPEGKLVTVTDGSAVSEQEFSSIQGEIGIAETDCIIRTREGGYSVHLASGQELMSGSDGTMTAVIYDAPMGRLVYAVAVSPDGSFTVFENTRTLRGAAEN